MLLLRIIIKKSVHLACGVNSNLFSPEDKVATEREHFYDIISVPFAFGWMMTMLLMPMQLLIRAFRDFWWTFGVFAVSMIGLYFFWYTKLPKAMPKVKEAIIVEPKLGEVNAGIGEVEMQQLI